MPNGPHILKQRLGWDYDVGRHIDGILSHKGMNYVQD